MLFCRIAFVFSGHSRTFVKPAVYESIRSHLIDAFDCEHDTFWYFSEDPRWSKTTNRTLRQVFRPASVVIAEETEEDEHSWHDGCVAPPFPNLDGVPRTIKFYEDPSEAIRIAKAMFGRLAEAYSLVENFERSNGFRYDWIVRARFDAGWYQRIPPVFPLPADKVYVPIQTWNGVNDQFAILPRHLAAAYFDAQSVLSCDTNQSFPRWYRGLNDVWQPETLLWRHLELRRVPFARLTIPAVVSRFEGTSRCLELSPHTLLGTIADALVAATTQQRNEAPLFNRLAKTAHVAACGAKFACCGIDLDLGDGHSSEYLDISPFGDRHQLCQHKDIGPSQCKNILAQLSKLSLLADDAAIAEDIQELERISEIFLRRRENERGEFSRFQINGPTSGIHPVAGPADAAKRAGWTGWLSVDSKAATDLWHSLLCTYLRLWPRAEAVAANLQWSLLASDCAGFAEHLAKTETWLHSTLVDDNKLTFPDYASLASNELGWQVWTIPAFPPQLSNHVVPALPAVEDWLD